MGRKISVANIVTAPAGTEGDVVLYTVEAAKRFRLERVWINWTEGGGFNLQLTIMVGIKQVAPEVGFYSGDGGHTEDFIDYEAGSGDRIIAHYKNTGTTDQKALVIVSGELLD